MKRKTSAITASGNRNFRQTEEYKGKVGLIKKEVFLKYQERLKDEKNIFKKLLILIQREIELRMLINELTSKRSLYLSRKET